MTAAAFEPRFSVDAPSLRAGKVIAGRPLPAWCADVLSFPACLLFELPSAPALGLHVPGVEGIVRVGAEGAVSFDGPEWINLVIATEADRVWPLDFTALCQKKAAAGALLTAEDVLDGAQPDRAERWSVGEVLDRLGVELLSVDLD